MAMLECDLHGSLFEISEAIDRAVNKSVSASVEDESYCEKGNCACSVKVYERYSYIGGQQSQPERHTFCVRRRRASYGNKLGRKSGSLFQNQHMG